MVDSSMLSKTNLYSAQSMAKAKPTLRTNVKYHDSYFVKMKDFKSE